MPVPLLVSSAWLAEHLHDPNIRIVDVRWYLFEKDKSGTSEYMRGHIPGAVYMDIDKDLASPPGEGPGRHPLPKPESFAEVAGRAGIGPQTHVVTYDDKGGATAARLWWLLRFFGHDNVSLLDGGINSWIAEGRPLESKVPSYAPTTFQVKPRYEMVVNAETVDLLRNDATALVLDVRAAERYEGKTEPIDPRAGHVPGAKSAPYIGNLREDMSLRAPEELKKRYAELGADKANKIVCYCGSGVNACQTIFALQLAGFDSVLYEGSWSDWSSQRERPLATGSDPR